MKKMWPKIIDNERKELGETLRKISKTQNHLSIATGYWDLPGTLEIFDYIKDYESVRLLIGQEPLMPRYKAELNLEEPDDAFPDKDISFDLASLPQNESYRKVVTELKQLITDGRLEVRIYRRSFLHAKCYIFGNYRSNTAIGIIGSSNFTKAGLTANTELNSLEEESRIVKSKPEVETDDYGHLSWFEKVWNDEFNEQWDGRFSELLGDSPVGDLVFGPYDMYIKTLWELYQDEIIEDEELSEDSSDILYSFQQRNAQLLLKKLDKYGLAMLADSVGLGKTITAGAVIKHYAHEKKKRRIYVIAPASLTKQWRDELASVLGLLPNDFEILSMQDTNSIQRARKLDRYAEVDMFVIDEAHNLRNDTSKRHLELLEWFSDNPASKVLLLTATPINNSLTDFVNQIQLASKGSLESFPVVYPTSKKNEVIDFFEAVKRLSSEMRKAENKGEKPDFKKVNRIMSQGLRHFLVRTTRSGIEKEGGLLGNDGIVRRFPVSKVTPAPYSFSKDVSVSIGNVINNNVDIFSGKDPRMLDVDSLLEQTQRTSHPLDNIDEIDSTNDEHTENVFVNVFQILLLVGFSSYRPETYQHRFYGKTPEEIKQFKLPPEESFSLQSQMSVHNMLRVTLLKRLESSQRALRKSLENYQAKLDYFSSKLDEGYIIKFKDIQAIRSQFGDDLELVEDYNKDTDEADQIELIPADIKKYNIQALKEDIAKDYKLLGVLIEICSALEENDDKLNSFSELFTKLISNQKSSNKILVFSYYADTIKYLNEKLPDLLTSKEFDRKSDFLTGDTKSKAEEITNRFSPISKTGKDLPEEQQIDYLFATDVLSEGQNLQDCGTLINFDLHWNPVRMIQRNGRINRLGSEHTIVDIYNMHPETHLESYLKLVHRLEQKIDRIKSTVGTDQSILGEKENPIEFIDQIEYAEKSDAEDGVLDLYDKDKATETFVKLDSDNEDFLSVDEYVLDLRRFLISATEEEKDRIQNIPVGKWSYLPEYAKSDISTPQILSLTRSKGTTKESGIDFETHIFIESDSVSGYKVDAVEGIEALKHLKTTSEDNERKVDRISYDRELVKKNSSALARHQAVKKKSSFKITPTDKKVLNELSKLLPGVAVDESLENIITKQDEKLMRDLFRKAKNDIKLHEQLLPKTINGFEKAVVDLDKQKSDKKEVRSVEGVLFYVK